MTRATTGPILALFLVVAACGDGDGGGGTDGGGDDDPGGDGGGGGGGGPYFPNGSVFYEEVTDAPLDPGSEETIAWLDDAGGWGAGDEFLIDLSLTILTAPAGTELRAFEPNNSHYSPDCDEDPVPVPAEGAIESQDGFACEVSSDCHMLVVDHDRGKLYEMYKANIEGDAFDGGCLAVWDMETVYGPTGRGRDCTSADAAGLPMIPLTFTSDELAAGEIAHAIRFILPNDRIRANTYVAPATHSTSSTDGDAEAPPYGARLRLRADYPVDELPSEGARVIARALQSYGMFLADGGQIALTGADDRFHDASYDGLLETDDLAGIRVTDFEVLDSGDPIEYQDDCTRN